MKTLTDIGKLKMFFPSFSKATIKTFTEIVTAVIGIRSASLYKCKDKMKQISGKKKTQADSHYKKLLRFFSLKGMEKFCDYLFPFLVSLIGENRPLLVMDRSNWKRGKKNINLLTIGVLWQNCFIPLAWKQMNKRGNSNFSDRETLLNRFIRLWKNLGRNIENMTLVADREFIGPEWLNYLHSQKMFFVFRLRENMRLGEIELGSKKKRHLHSYAGEIERYGIYQLPVRIGENTYWLVMTKNLKQDRKEPYVFFITNIPHAMQALSHYTQRWKIECCFKHLKSNGFNIEAMNFKDDHKIELFMGIIVTAYIMAIREGILEKLRKPFRIKKYANGKKYAAVSVFRKGVEILDEFLKTAHDLLVYLFAVFHRDKLAMLTINKIKNVQ